jgi:hypothetical protein
MYHSNAGGGGERVLWLAIKALAGLHKPDRPLHVLIYSGDTGITGEKILQRAQVRRVCLSTSVVMVPAFCVGGGTTFGTAWTLSLPDKDNRHYGAKTVQRMGFQQA